MLPPGAAVTALSAAQPAEVKEPAAAVHCDRSNCRHLALQLLPALGLLP